MNFFRIYKRFCKEREKRSYAQRSMRIKNLGKGGPCFITGCFIKPFKMIINYFYSFLLYIYNTQLKTIITEVVVCSCANIN